MKEETSNIAITKATGMIKNSKYPHVPDSLVWGLTDSLLDCFELNTFGFKTIGWKQKAFGSVTLGSVNLGRCFTIIYLFLLSTYLTTISYIAALI